MGRANCPAHLASVLWCGVWKWVRGMQGSYIMGRRRFKERVSWSPGPRHDH